MAALFAGLTLGPAGIPADAVLGDLVSRLPGVGAGTPLDELEATILWEIRAPRVALGTLVGLMLALAGGSYQAVFHNPLADPYLLGMSALITIRKRPNVTMMKGIDRIVRIGFTMTLTMPKMAPTSSAVRTVVPVSLGSPRVMPSTRRAASHNATALITTRTRILMG
jgi:hypothetical protein